jgi:hypothetical protein
MSDRITQIPALISELYKITARLSALFPERPFTPDGHLVGSIGEVVARWLFDLVLEENPITKGYDAATKSGETVQIKLTGGNRISIAADVEPPPAYLIVLTLQSESGFNVAFNGRFPAEVVTNRRRNDAQRIVQLQINALPGNGNDGLPECNSLDELNRLFGGNEIPLGIGLSQPGIVRPRLPDDATRTVPTISPI